MSHPNIIKMASNVAKMFLGRGQTFVKLAALNNSRCYSAGKIMKRMYIYRYN